MQAFMEKLGSAGMMVLVVGWIVSAPLGMVYWGAKGWLLGVVLSMIIPGFGVLSVLGFTWV
jgi:hypothetical protein